VDFFCCHYNTGQADNSHLPVTPGASPTTIQKWKQQHSQSIKNKEKKNAESGNYKMARLTLTITKGKKDCYAPESVA
jgi:hypothetical protein